MIKDLKKYYKGLFEKYGDSSQSVQHISTESQYSRFKILSNIDINAESIIDVGCGLGDMYAYLKNTEYSGRYLGLDFIPEFIELAKKKYTDNKKVDFLVSDITIDEIPTNYDYILLSGVFNNKFNESEKFMLNTISRLFDKCRKGLAFNAMSTYVDYEDDNLHYSNPIEVFDFCKRKLTRRIVLKHDYVLKKDSIPYEYTMYLYKENSK